MSSCVLSVKMSRLDDVERIGSGDRELVHIFHHQGEQFSFPLYLDGLSDRLLIIGQDGKESVLRTGDGYICCIGQRIRIYQYYTIFYTEHERCYIQSALSIDEPSKKEQEIASLMSEKWRSFGWHPIDVDGHNHDELRSAFSENSEGKPKVIISHTIKGHGAWRRLRAATSIPFGLYER